MRITRPLIVLALSVVAGLLASILAARWLQAQAGHATPVVVATGDIPIGTPLEAGMLTTLPWPPGQLPDGAVQDPGALIGRVTRTSLSRHEPVLEHRMAAPGSRGGLSAVIAPGKRALTVKVNEVMGVAGFALPGSLVDVMVNAHTEDSQRGSGASMSRIVLERIVVLAVAQESSRDATAPKVANAVTLEVTPEQAEKLDLARSVGALSLVLRNPMDMAEAQTHGALRGDLLGGQRGVPASSAARPEAKTAAAQRPPIKRVAQAKPDGEDTSTASSAAVPAGSSPHTPETRAELIRGTWRSSVSW